MHVQFVMGVKNAMPVIRQAFDFMVDEVTRLSVLRLFAEDGAVVFLSGEYRGHAGVMRLYGTWFQNMFTDGKRGPIHGFLLDHFQMQDIITVAPDRQTAKGRFRGMLFGGSHELESRWLEGVTGAPADAPRCSRRARPRGNLQICRQ